MRNGTSPIDQWSPKTKLAENRFIPNTAAQLPQDIDPEAKQFLISFKHYRDDLCQIDYLVKNTGRKGLMNMRVVGRCYDRSSLKSHNIDITPVSNAGAYKVLYSGLPDDAEILEHRIQSTARLFYFIVGNNFYVRAITSTHFETRKHH